MAIQENIRSILAQIDEAVSAAGRSENSVKLIAVSKTKPLPMIKEAADAGQIDFGENRVQELREKHPEMPTVHWHMIGSLQRNKVKYIAPFIYLIHSVDSERLLAEINKQAEKCKRVIKCLLQLNISDEVAKSGLDESLAKGILDNIELYPHIEIWGLMGMAEFTRDEEVVRSQFRRLKNAFDQFSSIDHPRIHMEELSMGMSGDFEIAIEEGATMVRIGSAVFGSRY